MKNSGRVLIYSGLFIGMFVIILGGCKKSDTTSDIAISYGTVSDFEGNAYKTVVIGTQTWMAENLRSIKLNDGKTISYVSDNSVWSNLTTPGYSYYSNDSTTYKAKYGALYNWYTVQTNKLCPTGWHVPSDTEWSALTTSLGIDSVAGGKLKEAGTLDWYIPNLYATNTTGFTALAGGYRTFNGSFNNYGLSGNWWSSTEYTNTSAARFFYLRYDKGYAYDNKTSTGKNFVDKLYGLSVRCVKN
jgi:uncharacterized protein (TIGR02145 family)